MKALRALIWGIILIELIMVIAITGILTSTAVPSYIKFKEKARVEVTILEIQFIEKENQLLLDDLEGNLKEYNQNEEIDVKLKRFKEKAHRCQIHLDNFQLIDGNTNQSGGGLLPQYIRDNQVLAEQVLQAPNGMELDI